MSINYKHIYPVNEIVGSFASTNLSPEDLDSFVSNPNDYLQSNLNVNYEGEIAVVQNTENEVNLTLPYYAMIEKISAFELTPEMLDEVAGGEIFITIAALCGAGIGFAVGGTALGLTGASLAAATIVGAGVGAGIATTVAAVGAGVGISERKKSGK